MRKNKGFNLLELMLAVTLSALVITLILKASSTITSNFIYNSSKVQINQKLRVAMNNLEKNINTAGVFGALNLHYVEINNYQVFNTTNTTCTNSDICNFDTATLGIKSLNSNDSQLSSIASESITIVSNTDIIKIQNPAEDPVLANVAIGNRLIKCSDNKVYLYQQRFPNTFDTSASNYFLAASNFGANLLYKPNFAFTKIGDEQFLQSACPGNASQLAIEAKVYHNGNQGEFNDPSNSISGALPDVPDMASLQIMKFSTRYYFIGSKNNQTGLYTKYLQDDGTLSKAILVSKDITDLQVSYLITNNNQNINNFPNTKTFQYITNPTNYLSIIGVKLILTGSAKSKSPLDKSDISSSITRLITW